MSWLCKRLAGPSSECGIATPPKVRALQRRRAPLGTLPDIGGKSFLDGTFLMKWPSRIVHIAVTVCGRPVLQKDSAAVAEEGPNCHVSNILSLCSGSESVAVVCRDLNEAHEKEGIDIRYTVYGSSYLIQVATPLVCRRA